MTTDEMNIAIAKICIPGITGPWGCYNAPQLSGKVNGEEWVIEDYCNNLNAMHEAEKILGRCGLMEYERALRRIVQGAYCDIIHATAAQRAEAFLKTKGIL